MWTLLDLNPFSVFERHHRRAQKLKREGTRGRGTITGIRGSEVGTDGGGHDWRWEFAVRARTAEGAWVAGVRQQLEPRVPLRLGMDVAVWHDTRHRAVIDWLEDGDQYATVHGWKRVEPPPDGIEDRTHGHKQLVNGRPARATITGVRHSDGFLGLGRTSQTRVLDLLVHEDDDARHVETRIAQMPPYATHLLREGLEVAVAIHAKKPGEVTIDWAAAARAEPGVGVTHADT